MDNPVTQFIGKNYEWLIDTWVGAQMGPVEMPASIKREAELAVSIYGSKPQVIEEGPEAAEVARFVLKYNLNNLIARPITQKNIDDYIESMGISFTVGENVTNSIDRALVISEDNQRERQAPHDIFISADRYPELGYQEILARLQQCKTPTQQGTSTFSISGPDDGKKATPGLAARYALAYGVNLENLSSLRLMISQIDTCNLFEGNEEGFFKRRLMYTGQNGGTSIELCGVGMADPANTRAIARAFIKTNQRAVDAAVQILLKAHPDLNSDILRSEYYDLIKLEFNLFNTTDLIQDAAAATYADSPYKDSLQKNFPDGTIMQLAFTKVGVAAWLAASQEVPIDHQGLGPLQIIPGIAKSAYQNPEIFDRYREILSDEDFADDKALLRAIFDPKKMFAVKALAWDLQLTNLKDSCPNLRASVMTPPFIVDDDFAHDLAVISGANHLVQFPEDSGEIYVGILEKRYSQFIIGTYINSVSFGFEFQLPQVRAYPMPDVASCIADMPSFGYVQDLDTGRTTCFKMNQ